jgi:hypothetical protein
MASLNQLSYGTDIWCSPFDIETKDLDAIVIFSIHSFLPSIELLAFVDVLSARVATPTPESLMTHEARLGLHAHREGRHKTHHLLRVLWKLSPWYQGWIEIRGKVLVQN